MLILLKSVPPLISYDVICVETLHLHNAASIYLFGQLIVALDSPCHRLSACQFWLKLIKSSQSY